MNHSRLTWAVLAACICLTACKNDDESDLIPPASAVKGIYINEVCSSGTDWVELYNSTDKDMDLTGFHLQDSKGAEEEYILPAGTKIPARGFLTLEKEKDFAFGISGSGEPITLLDASGAKADQVNVPALDDGQSYARSTDGGDNWQVTASPTKDKSNTTVPTPTPPTDSDLKGTLMINEVYTFADGKDINDLDYIELYNSSDKEIDLSGLKLWESGGAEEAWTFPQGKKIAAKGHLVVWTDKEGLHKDPVNYPAWGLSKGPDEFIVLADADMSVIDEVHCPSMKQHESYGRITDGAASWQIFAQATPGAANTGAARQPVTNKLGLSINEVFTNNQDKQTLAWDDTKDFIELYNSSDKDVDLSGFSLMDDALDEGKRYTFPAGTVIKAGGFLVLDVYKKNPDGPTFGLGKGGDWVFLYDKAKTLIAEIEIPALEDNQIYTVGRQPDGSDNIVVFGEASKGSSNNGKPTVSL